MKKRDVAVEQNLKHSGPAKAPEIMEAIENLVEETSRAEPNLVREDARQAIRRIVNDLLRDAG